MSTSMRDRETWSTRVGRMSVVLAFAALAAVGVGLACSDPQADPAGDKTQQPPSSMACSTPDVGCPCDVVGQTIPCGKKWSSDLNFIYCYEGTRACQSDGKWSECTEGSIVPKAINPKTTIHTNALAATSSVCSGGGSTAPIKVCVDGKNRGDECTSNLDCTNGKKKCDGASERTQDCEDDGDCNGNCVRYNGTCNGGANNNYGCDVAGDCPGGTCNPSGGGGNCGTYTGLCDSTGYDDGKACNGNVDCPTGSCKPDKHGHCVDGKKSGKKCQKNKHCKGSASCNADPDAGATLDPCDPYCNVYGDTPTGFDAGPGFTVLDGGLTVHGCGDGVLDPGEACDDGNTTPSDGCSASCALEPGYQCPTPGSPCTPATCGNGLKEGLEQCDDGNQRPYDGCYNCLLEVSCPTIGSPCVPVCGDGIKFPGEQCDDGNLRDNDGCSSACLIETALGATCNAVTAPLPGSIDVPVIFRDFTPTHPDFQMNAPHPVGYTGPYCNTGGITKGLPTLILPADREPTFAATGTPPCTAGATDFNQWYRDTPGVNQVLLGRFLRLFKSGSSYVFDAVNDTVTDPNINCGAGTAVHCKNLNGFWPINGLGFGNYAATGKNFHFTSEVRYPFTYAGGETLSFTGDDDVFVYVNGVKVVDIGGIHGPQSGSVTLANSTPSNPAGQTATLIPGETYEIDVFQAERNTTGSNYKLTLQGFNRTVSQCTLPTPPQTVIRDFEGVCPSGTRVEWQLFKWKALVTGSSNITYRAATADDPSTFSTNPNAVGTVPVGVANAANSSNPANWVYTIDASCGPTCPYPVSRRLAQAVPKQTSKQWLRVYMTFNGLPTLFEWQQLYDCIPAE